MMAMIGASAEELNRMQKLARPEAHRVRFCLTGETWMDAVDRNDAIQKAAAHFTAQIDVAGAQVESFEARVMDLEGR